MNPNIKCTCPFGNPSIGTQADCPIHGIKGTASGVEPDYPYNVEYGTPTTQPTMDEVRNEFGLTGNTWLDDKHILVVNIELAMQKWEQLTSAPLLAKIKELELGIIRMHENMLLGNHVEANKIGLQLINSQSQSASNPDPAPAPNQ